MGRWDVRCVLAHMLIPLGNHCAVSGRLLNE